MIRMLLGALFVLGISAALSGPSAAQEVTAWECNGCSSHQLSTAAIGKGVGTHYLHDLSAGQIYKYAVTKEDVQFGVWTYLALPLPVEPDAVYYYTELHALYVLNNNSFEFAVASTYHANAFDVVESTQTRNAVGAEIGNRRGLLTTLAQFGRALQLSGGVGLGIHVGTANVPLTVTVTFTDGSTAVYTYSQTTKRWEYVPNSAIDSHGHTIPETQSDFAGRNFNYDGRGNPDDVQRFINRAAMNGIPITGGTRWGCVWTPRGVNCYPF